ncbi:hypothetical protein FAM09_02865 [Niastella caeni]|uniref:Gliding motility protein GldL n=1 Tax=Niastella caeni TaxID=2569763 RepID=A0A4S8I2U8_9BACT|nr:hypothetical protein [Niastella caeni]THU41074.1 hypothetical protein FAM09_02865 [Niastella caeni]
MYKKLNDLQFVIGLFFTIVSVILLLNVVLGSDAESKLNVYTGAVFLVFGLAMMLIRKGSKA